MNAIIILVIELSAFSCNSCQLLSEPKKYWSILFLCRGVRKAADLTKPIDKRVYKVEAISSWITQFPFHWPHFYFSFEIPLLTMFHVKMILSDSLAYFSSLWNTFSDHVQCVGDLSNLPWLRPPWLSQDWTSRGWYCTFILYQEPKSWLNHLLPGDTTSGGVFRGSDTADWPCKVRNQIFCLVNQFRTCLIIGKSLVDCTTRSDWWTRAGCHA